MLPFPLLVQRKKRYRMRTTIKNTHVSLGKFILYGLMRLNDEALNTNNPSKFYLFTLKIKYFIYHMHIHVSFISAILYFESPGFCFSSRLCKYPRHRERETDTSYVSLIQQKAFWLNCNHNLMILMERMNRFSSCLF